MNNYQYAIITNEEKENKDFALQLAKSLPVSVFKVNNDIPEIIFVIGGDGTFLKAVNKYNKQLDKILFLLIKKGNIGFYHNFLPEEMPELIKELLTSKLENLPYNELDLLEVTTETSKYYAINEVRIADISHVLVLEIWINDELLEVFKGTGIFVATKSGSTGLLKVAGGAVIIANQSLMQVQEIFPVNNNHYRSLNAPLILDAMQTLTIKNITKQLDRYQKRVNNSILVIDTFLINDKLSSVITIKISENKIKLYAKNVKKDSLVTKLKKTFVKNK